MTSIDKADFIFSLNISRQGCKEDRHLDKHSTVLMTSVSVAFLFYFDCSLFLVPFRTFVWIFLNKDYAKEMKTIA